MPLSMPVELFPLASAIIPNEFSQRKDRDLKALLAILVGDTHDWSEILPSIRFALNSPKSDITRHTIAYLQFGSELLTIDDVVPDLKAVLDNDNLIPEIMPHFRYLGHYFKDS
ncbi:endonuclease [Caerostris extrusa]|uniref:Endonuclease n=1 Tax=Caerostris extrusa TaxID=172846 RepID=A0AAV4SP63_CAEEX|nr:endonuclease [Caerostris extrusa]